MFPYIEEINEQLTIVKREPCDKPGRNRGKGPGETFNHFVYRMLDTAKDLWVESSLELVHTLPRPEFGTRHIGLNRKQETTGEPNPGRAGAS